MFIMYKVIIIIFIFLISCSKNEEEIPSFITVNEFELISTSISGSSTKNISDVWFYVNDSLQGIYELPATFPVLKNGINNVRLKAGIKVNGISSTRVAYPFFTSYLDTIEFIDNNNIQIAPIINYNDNYNYIIEDFEGSGTIIDSTLSSEIDFSIETGIEGNKYGYARLDTPNITFECALDEYMLPQQGISVYLEMDYKCNSEFQIGIYSNYNQSVEKNDLLFVTPKEEWSKIYVNLTPTVSGSIGANSFRIYINQRRPLENSFSEICFDNIKIIY